MVVFGVVGGVIGGVITCGFGRGEDDVVGRVGSGSDSFQGGSGSEMDDESFVLTFGIELGVRFSFLDVEFDFDGDWECGPNGRGRCIIGSLSCCDINGFCVSLMSSERSCVCCCIRLGFAKWIIGAKVGIDWFRMGSGAVG